MPSFYFFGVIGVEEFGLDLSAFVNVSTTIDEPAVYLGLFTDSHTRST